MFHSYIPMYHYFTRDNREHVLGWWGRWEQSYPLHSLNYRSSECSFLSRVLSILLDAVTVLTGPPVPKDGSSCSLMTKIPKNEPFLEWWGAKSVMDPLKTVLGFPQEDFRESKCLVAKAIFFCDLITAENRNDGKYFVFQWG